MKAYVFIVNKIFKKIYWLAYGGILFSYSSLYANNNITTSIKVNVSVKIQSATCDITNQLGGDNIEVDFETITKKGILNGDYKSSIPIKIVCSDGDPAMTLKLIGDGANFDTTLLKSQNNESLGFEFQINNQKFSLGSVSSSFMNNDIPSLTVMPKLNPKTETFTAGEFNSASAKLVLEYE